MDKQTSKPEYVKPIVEALQSFGSGSEDEVLEAVFHNIKDKLYPADFVVLPNGEPRWRNQAQNMIDGLIEDGIIVKKYGKLWLR